MAATKIAAINIENVHGVGVLSQMARKIGKNEPVLCKNTT